MHDGLQWCRLASSHGGAGTRVRDTRLQAATPLVNPTSNTVRRYGGLIGFEELKRHFLNS